jgi:hypothetical protein
MLKYTVLFSFVVFFDPRFGVRTSFAQNFPPLCGTVVTELQQCEAFIFTISLTDLTQRNKAGQTQPARKVSTLHLA